MFHKYFAHLLVHVHSLFTNEGFRQELSYYLDEKMDTKSGCLQNQNDSREVFLEDVLDFAKSVFVAGLVLLLNPLGLCDLDGFAQEVTESSITLPTSMTSEANGGRLSPLDIRPESELRLEVEHLLNAGSILYVAAHPDDENNLLFSKLARGDGYRVGYFCFTRGEGGQNLIGKEQGNELGILRTQELLAARKVDGAEQLFGGMNDFGYSKSADETFRFWGKDLALAALVKAIREFQPDIIITRFPTSGEGGHGHHTASAILAEEAFEAAADSNRFPEQLAQLQVWRASRLLYNRLPERFLTHGKERAIDQSSRMQSNEIEADSTSPSQTGRVLPSRREVRLSIKSFHPAIGESFAEISARARSLHRSQGMGTISDVSPVNESFQLISGKEFEEEVDPVTNLSDPGTHSLLSGLDISWSKFESGSGFVDEVKRTIGGWNSAVPESNLINLLAVLRALRSLPRTAIRDYKEQRITRLIREIAGIRVSGLPEGNGVPDNIGLANKAVAVGDEATSQRGIDANLFVGKPLKLKIYAESKVKLSIQSVKPTWAEQINLSVSLAEDSSWSSSIVLPTDILKPGDYLGMQWRVSIDGVNLTWDEPLYVRTSHPVFGEQGIPLRIVPDFSVTPLIRSIYLPLNNKDWRPINFSVKRWNSLKTFVDLTAIVGRSWEIEGPQQRVNFSPGVGGKKVVFRVRRREHSGVDTGVEGVLSIKQVDESAGAIDIRALREISYPHIIPQITEETSDVKLISFKSSLSEKRKHRVGFIPGASDTLPDYLRSWGYNVEILDMKALQEGNLFLHDVVILGIRSLAVQESLNDVWPSLERYALGGGVLLVLYQQTSFNSGVQIKIGDALLRIGKARVTNEDAPVRFINPVGRILRFPNAIQDRDFSDWIQERGLSFAQEWNERCIPALEMSDPGEVFHRGALLDCHVGKGRLIYTGLSFFRQIPNGNAGALRLMENLLIK